MVIFNSYVKLPEGISHEKKPWKAAAKRRDICICRGAIYPVPGAKGNKWSHLEIL